MWVWSTTTNYFINKLVWFDNVVFKFVAVFDVEQVQSGLSYLLAPSGFLLLSPGRLPALFLVLPTPVAVAILEGSLCSAVDVFRMI